MANTRGNAYALTLLARIEREREDELRDVLAKLPSGHASPLAELPGTHYARFVIVPELEDCAYLIFSSTFNGGRHEYLSAMCDRIPQVLDSVFGPCDRWPGAGDRQEAMRWFDAHQLRTTAFTGGYPDATLDEVLEALQLRERLRAFAPGAQGMDAEQLQAAFKREFGQ